MSNFFNGIKQGKPLEVFEIGPAIASDPSPLKADLCAAGSYVTENGDLWVFPVVERVEAELAEAKLDKSYLPVLGLEEFTKASTRLVLGEDSKCFQEGRFVAAQSLSGTGALRIVAEFLAKVVGLDTFYTAIPTWENHHRIFLDGRFKNHREHRTSKILYYIASNCTNPTGVDPTPEQWHEIGMVCKERGLFPVFDCVRQGFVKDLNSDVWCIRHFADTLGLEIAICQSYAKNFALYNERVENAVIVTQGKDCVSKIKSQLTLIIRGSYSNPPAHGARIAARILNNPKNLEELEENLATVINRVQEMREKLFDKLVQLGCKSDDWEHIKTQLGIFVYSGLTPEQVDVLRNKYHLYMLRCCHINVCGLNDRNIHYIAHAIYSVTKEY